jgi:uncharacterized protein (TIGR00730 family)
MRVCVFCGSSSGTNRIYKDAAIIVANLLSKNNLSLVYGGGNIGIMGIIADQMMANGSSVIGVIPEFLMNREVGHRGISTLEIVPGMHERKKRMAELSDAFIALPGGVGTLEELTEILTWKQLGIIKAPVGLLNVNGFFDPFIAQLKHMTKEGFLKVENLEQLVVENDPEKMLTSLGVVSK